MTRRLILLALVTLLAGCGGSAQSGAHKQLLVVVNAPFSRTPYLGQTIENGVRLAAGEVNAAGATMVRALIARDLTLVGLVAESHVARACRGPRRAFFARWGGFRPAFATCVRTRPLSWG